MEENTWAEHSREITDKVISHPWFLAQKDIYIYVDYNREVGTQRLIEASFRMGKNVWVPKVMGEVMHFFRIGSLKELRPGAYGIPEPMGDSFMDREVPSDGSHTESRELRALMIMPGAAFGENCARIGYGGGYYDRYLAEHPKFHRMALAFEFQIFPEAPQEDHDICPELVITEKRILKRILSCKDDQ